MNEFQKSELLSLFLANDGFIVVHRSIIKLFGNSAANFLAELISEYNYYKKENELKSFDNKLWFYSSVANIEENVGFSKKEQINLIKKLSSFSDSNNNTCSILETKQMGMPQQRYFYINFDAINELLEKNAELIGKGYKKSKIDKNGKSVQNNTENPDYLRMYKKDIQECTKGTFKNVQKNRFNDTEEVDFSRSAQRELQEVPKGNFKKAQKGTSRSAQKELQEVPKGNINNNNITIINNNNNKPLSFLDTNKLNNTSKILKDTKKERKTEVLYGFLNIKMLVDELNQNIDFDILQEKYSNSDKFDVYTLIRDQIMSILSSDKEYFIISGEKIDKLEFVNRIMSYDSNNIDSLINTLHENRNNVKNLRNYVISLIYYSADVKDFKITKKSSDMSREEWNKFFEENVLNKIPESKAS